MRIEYHRTLIADHVRNKAFARALETVICSSETTVADIGAGTGILALMAARLGAREVFLYEAAEVASVAAKVLKANCARNCHLIPCHSMDMDDPPRVDVVVSETLGNYPFEENTIETLNDARCRFLKTGGVIIPGRLEQFVAPAVSERIHSELSAWEEVEFDIDLSPAMTMTLNNIYVRSMAPKELLDNGASAKTWDAIDFTRQNRSARKGAANWRLSRATTIFGFVTWWVAELVPGIVLSTAPNAPRTHWEQLYLPLLKPIKASGGETVSISLRSRTSMEEGTHVAWTATRLNAKGQRLEHQALNLDKGFLP